MSRSFLPGPPSPFCPNCRVFAACPEHAARDSNLPQPHPGCYACATGHPCAFHGLPEQQAYLSERRAGRDPDLDARRACPAPPGDPPEPPSHTGTFRGRPLRTDRYPLSGPNHGRLSWSWAELETHLELSPGFLLGRLQTEWSDRLLYGVDYHDTCVFESGAYRLLSWLPQPFVPALCAQLAHGASALRALFENTPFESSAPSAASPPPRPKPVEDWRSLIRTNKDGHWLAVYSNLVTLLRDKPFWGDPSLHPTSPFYGTPGGRLCFNEMTRTTHILMEPLDTEGNLVRGRYELHAVNDEWFAWIRHTIARTHFIDPDKALLSEAITDVSFERKFHPVRDYLRALHWDGSERIRYLADAFLSIPTPTDLQRSMLRRFLVSAVARVMEPGCKCDTVLVLFGKQGLLKSTFFKVLAGAWFCDSPMDLSNHAESCRKMTHAWIYEWSEIGKVTRKKDSDEIKAFITSSTDLYRALYARVAEWHPRSMVFAGTTNDQEFLVDASGSRRFWVLPITQPVQVALLTSERDQIWAESVAAYDRGEPWHLSDPEEDERAYTHEAYESQDPWYPVIRKYLETRTNPAELTTSEILGVPLGLDRKDYDRSKQHRVSEILRLLGWRSVQPGGRSDRSRVWRTFPQKSREY